MTVQIYYKNRASKKILGNLILFVNEKFDIKGLKNDNSVLLAEVPCNKNSKIWKTK